MKSCQPELQAAALVSMTVGVADGPLPPQPRVETGNESVS
jgi:hypothetical protein